MFGWGKSATEQCHRCHGSGLEDEFHTSGIGERKSCSECYGKGVILIEKKDKKFKGDKRRQIKSSCAYCNGSGRQKSPMQCNDCSGTGWRKSFWGNEETKCSTCSGSGTALKETDSCNECHGSGQLDTYEYYIECNKCSGVGEYHDIEEKWVESGDYGGEMKTFDRGWLTCDKCSGNGGYWK